MQWNGIRGILVKAYLMRKTLTLIAAFILSSCTASTITVELAPSSEAQVNFDTEQIPEEGAITQVEIPKTYQLNVPFMVQAPFADWEKPYDEACEEASIIMVDYFLRGLDIPPQQPKREILQLTNRQESNHYSDDVTIEELAEIVEEYYGYKTRISESVSKESIMYEISKGNPVILPLAGREIGNPYFSGAGPWYHMLVVTGYDQRNFITNDPGTKRGEDFEYAHSALINNVHDFPGVKEEIKTGVPRMLVISN